MSIEHRPRGMIRQKGCTRRLIKIKRKFVMDGVMDGVLGGVFGTTKMAINTPLGTKSGQKSGVF